MFDSRLSMVPMITLLSFWANADPENNRTRMERMDGFMVDVLTAVFKISFNGYYRAFFIQRKFP